MSDPIGEIQTTRGTLEQWGAMTPTSLELNPATPFDAWSDIGVTIGRLSRGAKWHIGDWINFGETIYGEKYSQALEVTGYELQTLTNLAFVARRVAPTTRFGDLTWAHHQEVARFKTADEQTRWLTKAATENLTSKELRDLITAEFGADPEKPARAAAETKPPVEEILGKVCKAVLGQWMQERSEGGGFAAILDPVARWPLIDEITDRIVKDAVKAGVKR